MKDDIKVQVKERKIKILVGTDAASEGLNLQTLSTLINLDLPWNPTRLEQRKGRIQRIGQLVIVYLFIIYAIKTLLKTKYTRFCLNDSMTFTTCLVRYWTPWKMFGSTWQRITWNMSCGVGEDIQ